MKLLKVDTIASARVKLKEVMQNKTIDTFQIDLLSAQGYILAKDIIAEQQIPSFARSSVDGYAVVSKDTAGAAESIPVFLEIVDEVLMGESAEIAINSGHCVYVPTGGMIPVGADAVVMVEYCELFDKNQIAVYYSVACGKNIIAAGEDMNQGDLVLEKGTKINPQDIGVLACLGITKIEVFKPFTVSIISTGDELVSPDRTPPIGKIRDINSYMLKAEANKQGFQTFDPKVIPDDEALLKSAMMEAMHTSDIVVVSGGSSQGKKDATERMIDEVADGGSFLHGLALKPGKPTILGYDKKTASLLIGLPGNPVAALIVFKLLVGWVWKDITGQSEEFPVKAHITENIPSDAGKMTCQLVKLKKLGGYYAEPVFGKSGLITTLTRSNGYIIIPENKEGLNKDEIVEVFYL